MWLEKAQNHARAVQPCSQTKLQMESPGLQFSDIAPQGDLRHFMKKKGKIL